LQEKKFEFKWTRKKRSEARRKQSKEKKEELRKEQAKTRESIKQLVLNIRLGLNK
jgi:hypothetical protein